MGQRRQNENGTLYSLVKWWKMASQSC